VADDTVATTTEPTTNPTTEPKPKPGRTARNRKEERMPAKTEAEAPTGEVVAESRGGGRKKLVILLLVVLLLAAAGYLLVLKPKSSTPGPPPKPVAGVVVKLDPITVNLAGGHFLKLGLSLQATADAGEDVSGAKALDAAIDLFSNKTIKELATRDGREGAKAQLVKKMSDLYEGKVYDVYFTDFVMQ
jgi:flagellar FliL protein